jgi:hypothetical protein
MVGVHFNNVPENLSINAYDVYLITRGKDEFYI